MYTSLLYFCCMCHLACYSWLNFRVPALIDTRRGGEPPSVFFCPLNRCAHLLHWSILHFLPASIRHPPPPPWMPLRAGIIDQLVVRSIVKAGKLANSMGEFRSIELSFLDFFLFLLICRILEYFTSRWDETNFFLNSRFFTPMMVGKKIETHASSVIDIIKFADLSRKYFHRL